MPFWSRRKSLGSDRQETSRRELGSSRCRSSEDCDGVSGKSEPLSWAEAFCAERMMPAQSRL